jgi:hypothetical protein
LASPAAPASPPRVRRHLRNYILDRRLQLRYVLIVTLVSAAVAAVLGYFIWYQKSYATQTIIDSLNRTDWIDAGLKAEISRTLKSTDAFIIRKMALIACGIFALLTLFLIVMTHKVAGPLFKIGQDFDRIVDGSLAQLADLRHGDYLADFFTKFKAMHEAVRARATHDADLYGRFLEIADKAGFAADLGEQATALRALRDERLKSLSGS